MSVAAAATVATDVGSGPAPRVGSPVLGSEAVVATGVALASVAAVAVEFVTAAWLTVPVGFGASLTPGTVVEAAGWSVVLVLLITGVVSAD